MQWLISAAFILTFFISPKLWLDHRFVPTAPIFGQSEMPVFINYLLIGTLLISVVLSPLSEKGFYELVAVLCLLILISYDIQRFQLEIYLFLIWFLMMGLFKHWLISEMAILATIQLSILAVYVMGGIMKINPWFYKNVYYWVISPLNELPGGSLIERGWILAPITEIGVGLLMFRKTRILGIFAAVAYHLMMLWLFGPWGNDYHAVMWPMQGLLAVLVVFVFSAEDFKNPFSFVTTCFAPKVALVLFYVLPLFHLVGWFDAAPCFASYDGRHYLGYVAVEQYVVKKLPPAIRSKMKKVTDHDKYLIPIDNLVSTELKVPFYHEKRVYMRYKHWLEPYADHPGDVFAVVMHEEEIEILQD